MHGQQNIQTIVNIILLLWGHRRICGPSLTENRYAAHTCLCNAHNHSIVLYDGIYEGNSISKLQIQVATYVFELRAGNCHR